MKKFFLYIVAVMLLLGFNSCTDKKTVRTHTFEELADSLIDKPNFEMDSQDSAEVYSLVTQYLDKLREGKIDEAVGMLYYLVNDSIIAMPAKAVQGQKAVLSRFQGVRYDLESISYDDETDNLARYTVTLFEKKDANDTRANTMSFGLNPVRRQGKWFLTLSNRDNRLHEYRKSQQRSH
jgi:hypothetical protein